VINHHKQPLPFENEQEYITLSIILIRVLLKLKKYKDKEERYENAGRICHKLYFFLYLKLV